VPYEVQTAAETDCFIHGRGCTPAEFLRWDGAIPAVIGGYVARLAKRHSAYNLVKKRGFSTADGKRLRPERGTMEINDTTCFF